MALPNSYNLASQLQEIVGAIRPETALELNLIDSTTKLLRFTVGMEVADGLEAWCFVKSN